METTRPSELIEEMRAMEYAHRVQSRDGFRPDHGDMADRYGSYADALEKATADTATAYADRDAALERLGAVLAERDQLARLHEEATERTVAFAAVIEQAYQAALMVSGKEAARVLASADTDAALREVRAEAFDEGAESVAAVLDVTHGVPNPYREGAKTDG